MRVPTELGRRGRSDGPEPATGRAASRPALVLLSMILTSSLAFVSGERRDRSPASALRRARCSRTRIGVGALQGLVQMSVRLEAEVPMGEASGLGSKVAVVAGAGPGNGLALARRFSEAGYAVAMLARDLDRVRDLAGLVEGSVGLACNVADPGSVASAFETIRSTLGEVEVLVFNAGSGVFAGVEAITPAQFEQAWRVNALGSLLCSQQVIGPMRQRGDGSIVFIGATASVRGGPNSAAFAPAKAAQRSLAESMARSLWPAGIHVALIVVDGVVDIPRTRARMPDKPDRFFIDPAGVAETAYQLVRQSRQAWSFLVEARPFEESW